MRVSWFFGILCVYWREVVGDCVIMCVYVCVRVCDSVVVSDCAFVCDSGGEVFEWFSRFLLVRLGRVGVGSFFCFLGGF